MTQSQAQQIAYIMASEGKTALRAIASTLEAYAFMGIDALPHPLVSDKTTLYFVNCTHDFTDDQQKEAAFVVRSITRALMAMGDDMRADATASKVEDGDNQNNL